MWRRACLGVRDDAVTLLLLWGAVTAVVLLAGASARGWIWGAVAASAFGTVTQSLFRWSRRRWERRVRDQGVRVLAEAQALLGRKVD